MAVTQIDLLRHGEVEGGSAFNGSSDAPLTQQGLAQMQRASAADCAWNRVITSPLQRCTVFADAFAQRHGLPLQRDERLQEIHFGAWEGRSSAAIWNETPAALERFWADPETYPPPGGESLSRFRSRVMGAWNDIIEGYQGERLLVVTHGGVIRLLLCHVRGWPLSRLLQIEVEHGALFRITVDADGVPRCGVDGEGAL